MTDKMRTPVVGGTATGARAETTIEAASISIFNPTTRTGEMQAKVADHLLHGAENAIPTRDLMQLCGFRTARQLQKQIERERATGALILSATTGGYYLPADGDAGRSEILRYERTLRARAINTLATLKTARQALWTLDGQLVMQEGADYERTV